MSVPYEDIKRYYQETILEHPGWYGKVSDADPALGFILQHIPKDKSAPILDAGCGNGRFANKLSELGYRDISAIDLIDGVDGGNAFKFKRASLESLPFEDDSFDFIYSVSAIYHLKDPADAIREFARVLRPGGRLVASVHSKYSLFTAYNVARMRMEKRDAIHLKNATFYSPQKYGKILKKNGMRVVAMDGYRLSFLYERLYIPVVYKIKKETGVFLPLAKGPAPQGSFFRFLRSMFAYHTVIIAEKQPES